MRRTLIGSLVGVGVLVGGAVFAVQRAGAGIAAQVAEEVEGLFASAEPAPIPRERLATLPPVVRRYLDQALGDREQAPASLRLQHGGTFRAGLESSWQPIRGQQYFSADVPGFLWWGRLRVAPGIHVDARDASQQGRGSMRILLASLLPLGDVKGPQMDQGALLRLLAELAWMPTAYLDGRYVRWEAIDETSARAFLQVAGTEVSGTFHFGADGLPTRFEAMRFMDEGDGRATLTPWSGLMADFRQVEGLLVPHRLEARWELPDGDFPYARFGVERLEYDVPRVF